jgi:hypothetical protein
MTPDEFFAEQPLAQQLFTCVCQKLEAIGEAGSRIGKSQIAFRRRRAFAWVWMPGRYLRGRVAPLVLTISLPRRDDSPRWKEVVEPARGRFIHHLELYADTDIDNEVRAWLREAWDAAA